MMNSFLFNVWLLLLCAVACVQFCFAAFQSYAQLTAIDMLLGVQVRTIHTQHKRRITHTAHTQLTHTPSLLPLRSLQTGAQPNEHANISNAGGARAESSRRRGA